MKLAPIVLFVYNRPEKTRAAIKSVMLNPESKNSVLYIFSDAPKKVEDENKVNEVRKIIHSIPKSSFREIIIVEQQTNQGLAKSIISGVNSVFVRFDKIIVLEDDCEVSPFFLNYINNALEKYEDNNAIGSISGYSPELKTSCKEDVYAVMRSCSMVWASWKCVWEQVDFGVKNYKKLRNNLRFIHRMNRAGNDRMYRFIRQFKYNIQSWSIRFGADLTKRGLLTVYPKYSYVKNNGFDDGGEHSSADTPKSFKTDYNKAIEKPVFPVSLVVNKKIEREFRKIYGGKLSSVIKRAFYVYAGEWLADLFYK